MGAFCLTTTETILRLRDQCYKASGRKRSVKFNFPRACLSDTLISSCSFQICIVDGNWIHYSQLSCRWFLQRGPIIWFKLFHQIIFAKMMHIGLNAGENDYFTWFNLLFYIEYVWRYFFLIWKLAYLNVIYHVKYRLNYFYFLFIS